MGATDRPVPDGVFERMGVRRIINGKGPATRLSGGLMRPEVAAAMAEAAQACVDMAELQARASALIAGWTGAEAGLVTSGAAAGLLLGTAACVTGLDPGRMNRLPDTAGMPDEVVVVRSQRNMYDHAVRMAGVRLVEVGLPDRYAGAGERDAEAWELAAAFGSRSAAVLWVADARARPQLAEVVEVAHARNVPVLVDAAAQLPPADNLRRFIAAGADLVAFSGGKAIGGPQASGILCGRRDLIMAAALQQLDMDLDFAHWQPPAGLIDKARLVGLPQHGVGRPCKVGKEQIVGLLTALERFIAEDPAARRDHWQALLDPIAGALDGVAGVQVTRSLRGEVPWLALELTPADADLTARALLQALEQGEPSIRLDGSEADAGRLWLCPMTLAPDQPAIIAASLRAHLAGEG